MTQHLQQRIVFIDLDGTIIDFAGRVALSTISAIRDARANGHLVVLCTGRTKPEIPDEIWGFGFDGAIMAGGAHTELDGLQLEQHLIPETVHTKMIEWFETSGWDYVFYSTDTVRPSKRMRQRFSEIATAAFATGLPPAPGGSIQISPFVHPLLVDDRFDDEDKSDSLIKALFLNDSGLEREDFAEQFAASLQVVPASIAALPPGSGEVTAFGVNKGTAVTAALKYFGFDVMQAIGIGDSHNDLEMLRICGTSVAMFDAETPVADAVDFITGTVLEGGVNRALAHFGLIGQVLGEIS